MNRFEQRREFSKRLITKMHEKGIDKKTLVIRSGIPEIEITRYLTGVSPISTVNATRLANVLSCDISDLTGIKE